jgi:non-specific serine/threonine protein kinase
MLETIREYALEQLDAHQEAARVRDHHLHWCADLAGHAAQYWHSRHQRFWIDRFEDEHDNFRAALQWAVQLDDPDEHGVGLASILRRIFWSVRGHQREGRVWLEKLLPHARPGSHARADGLMSLGYLALRQNDYSAASPAFQEALEIFRALDDRPGIAETLQHFGVVWHHLGEYGIARSLLEEGLALIRVLGNPARMRVSLRNLADLHTDAGDYPAAAAAYEDSLASAREHGDDHEAAYALRGLGHLARVQGQYARAEECLRESLTLLKPLRDRRCVPLTLEGMACITVGPGWAERAARLLGAAHAMQARTGAPSPPSALADYQRTVADARQELGPERFNAIWAEGTTMGLDAAVDLALAAPRPDAVGADARRAVPTPADTHAPVVPLSPREREVVTLIAQGLSNRQISEQLTLSVRTVERHIENVYNRLGITGKAGRAIVTAYALRHRLLEPV